MKPLIPGKRARRHGGERVGGGDGRRVTVSEDKQAPGARRQEASRAGWRWGYSGTVAADRLGTQVTRRMLASQTLKFML